MYKMKGFSLHDNKELKNAKKKAKQEQKDKFKSGDITRKEYKLAKKEIRKYKDY